MSVSERNKRVLVIDDDNDILDIMEEILTYEGFEVSRLAETGNIAPDVQKYDPDIIIMDYILQGINGGEICHQIKTNPQTSTIPIILISAYPRVFNSLGTYGCDAFISKPFDLNQIVDRIHDLISSSQNIKYAR